MAGTGASNGNNKKFFPKKFGGVSKCIVTLKKRKLFWSIHQKYLFSAKMKPVSAAVKKKRANYRLRKMLSPKSPLMVVNEMVGSVTYNFVDAPVGGGMAPGIPHLFTAQCIVDGQTFSGTGPSKQIAKNICAEHVIQFVVTKKCNEARTKTTTAPTIVTDATGATTTKPNVSEFTKLFGKR